MDAIKELKADIAELESLQSQATRQKVKGILSIECRKLVTEVTRLEEEVKNNPQTSDTTSKPISNAASKRYQVRLTNYAWDQTNSLLKFYVTLQKVQELPPENINCNFTHNSLELTVSNLDGKDYVFVINNLLHAIIPEKSTWKAKNDMVIINVAKETAQDWSSVTELEEKAKQLKKIPEMDKSEDPTAGLMSLMKNIYETGDDEMKRTIAKAWTERQQKPSF